MCVHTHTHPQFCSENIFRQHVRGFARAEADKESAGGVCVCLVIFQLYVKQLIIGSRLFVIFNANKSSNIICVYTFFADRMQIFDVIRVYNF